MWWLNTAFAGTLMMHFPNTDELARLDTRTNNIDIPGMIGADDNAGMTMDPDLTVWAINGHDLLATEFPYRWVDDWSWWIQPAWTWCQAIGWDDTLDQMVFFGKRSPTGLFTHTGQLLVDPQMVVYAATWDPSFDGFLVMTGINDLQRIINYGPPQFAGLTHPNAVFNLTAGLAYDADLKIVWQLTTTIGLYGYDPLTLEQVAWLPPPTREINGGASPVADPSPGVDPALLVTGTCPGEVFVTVADATPGGSIRVVSSTTSGSSTVPTGPCRGTSVDLANPRLRGTLQANSLGLASVRIQTTPAMCGSWQLQALDVGTCQVTPVRSVP